MNLKEFNFPKMDAISIAFSTVDTDKDLLKEATERGFLDGNTPYNILFSKAFFNGGSVTFKKDVDPSFKEKAWPYCRALMASFAPKHEHKEAVCAMLMSELLEPQLG